MPTTAPCTIVGRLLKVDAELTHGLAQLSFTLELAASPDEGAPYTVICLMAYGREPHAWAACQRAAQQMRLGSPYRASGADLRTAGQQLWLIGVEHWAALPDDALPRMRRVWMQAARWVGLPSSAPTTAATRTPEAATC